MKLNSMLLACVAGSLLSACGGPVEQEGEPGNSELAQHESALCTDVVADAKVYFSSGAAGFQTKQSSRTYGSASCSGYFVVDVVGIGGHGVEPLVQWWDYTPTTQAACEGSILTAQLWGNTGSGWVPVGKSGNTVTRYGFWAGSYCRMDDAGWGQFNPSPYLSFRIAVRGTVPGKYGPEQRAVSAGVYDMSVPR
jgi:hypothetical protein